MAVNVELNVCLRCNLRCTNCNRHCDRWPKRTDDMTLEQVDDFVHQAKGIQFLGLKVGRVKVLGGEPLLSPIFPAIYDLLVAALDAGIIGNLKIDTNKTLPKPDVDVHHPGVRWMGRRQGSKRHLPTLWAPRDMGYRTSGPCSMVRRCGFSLDNRGWLPCSAAIMIARVFHLEHLYKDNLPTEPWGMDELCPLCVFSMPPEWCAEHSYPIFQTPPEAKMPTASWADALENYKP